LATRHNAVRDASIRSISSVPALSVEKEPPVAAISEEGRNPDRVDFAVTMGNSRYFYDVQIVALLKDSARDDPYSTLQEASKEKQRKCKSLEASFHPIIISAGGLMEKDSAQAYKQLQHFLGPWAASHLDTSIGLALTKTRAISIPFLTFLSFS
jgi:hypothetical protein